MVKLKHESTTDTELYEASTHTQLFCPLSSGKTVLYASKTLDPRGADDCKFYLCDRHGYPTGQTIDAVCDHDARWIRFVPVTINTQEYLCVSCKWTCKNIRLINLETNVVRTAYMGIDVARMCLGESNTLFTVDVRENISVFNTSSTNFTLKRTLPKINISDVYNMYYMEEHDMIVIGSLRDNKLCAVRSSDGQIVWNLSKELVQGKKLDPRGLVYLPQVDLLIFGDKYNSRLITVSGKSGNVVQTVKMEKYSYIDVLHVRGDELIAVHGGITSVKLNFYSVSFI